MSFKKFKFISPGIFINEIDRSQLPNLPTAMGPLIIGRTEKGPALKPIQVNSFSEYVQMFGNPIPGGKGGDVFREGNYTAPTYAAYAAQAWFRNNSPVTVMRLLGQTNADATAANKATAYAGWQTTNIPGAGTTDFTTNGGAYGLFIAEGQSALKDFDLKTAYANQTTGTLAAIWYLNSGAIALSGQVAGGTAYTASINRWIQAVGTGKEFKTRILGARASDVTVDTAFNFNSNSSKFIRKVFNTNPTYTNSDISSNTVNYWLGESFEGNLGTFSNGYVGISGTVAADTFGIILKLGTPDGSTIDGGDFKMSSTKSPSKQFAKTGWFISQDVATNTGSYNPESMQKLFRFVSRELGEETQRKVKISIKDIKVSQDPNSQYGSFTILVRDIKDTDDAPKIIEQYNNCTLNPASDNYIAKKIGNSYLQWDDQNRMYRYYGKFPNNSDYVYVEMNEDVDRGVTNAVYLPYGAYGPVRYFGWHGSGSAITEYKSSSLVATAATGTFVVSSSKNPFNAQFNATQITGSKTVLGRFMFPKLRLRISSSDGNSLTDPTDAYFGADTTYNSSKFNESVWDVIRTKADDLSGFDAVTNKTENTWVFSLDDVRNEFVTASNYAGGYSINAVYESGSRVNGTSYTAHAKSSAATTGIAGPATASYENVLDYDFNRFTTCLAGGADGLDIKERDPFNNTDLSSKTDATSYAYNSISVAIDAVRDPERVEYNLITMPGLTNNALNTKMIRMCEDRGDAMAIVDLQGGYKPDTESAGSEVDRKGVVSTTITNLKNDFQPNSSYACAYYPWVQIRDTINGATLWAPPSVVALGAMSYGEATSQLWFAPAGFTRGGLSANQAAGIPVTGVNQRLTSKDRDKLYEAGINPIATFPAEGIVIFGQKTLQLTPSALDRINVRRLVIYLKKQISRFAATILFDQNVETTWNRFKSKVEPFLSDVKAGLGITDYRLILDETTTTPDLIDRNIMYAKIFVKPARAIEYIAIDFVISDSGASFED